MNRKPRLLFISQNLPKRFASSGVMRLYYFVELLCRDFDVTVASYFMSAFDVPENVAALEELGATVEAVDFDYPNEGSDRFSMKLPNHVRSLLDARPFDIIHLERFWMHLCLEDRWDNLGIPVVLDEIDVEYKREERRLELVGASDQEWATWQKEKEQELDTCRRASRVIAVTEADKQRLLNQLPGLDIEVIPTGQDVGWLNHDSVSPLEYRPKGVTFCGDYRHNPNVDAAVYLAKEVWPTILASQPDARLTLLGGSPPDEVMALADESIEVPGWVDDLRPYYRREQVVLAPIRFGSGIKAKIIEAAAFGLPVVTTTIGAEGLELETGRDCFVEDEASGLAKRTLQLLKDDALCKDMGARAQRQARKYDWETLYPRYRDIYLSLVTEKHSTGT